MRRASAKLTRLLVWPCFAKVWTDIFVPARKKQLGLEESRELSCLVCRRKQWKWVSGESMTTLGLECMGVDG